MAKKEAFFDSVDPKTSFPKLEEEILDYWEKNKVFEKSLEKTKKGPRFVFYEGPPTANGKPHLGHVVTRSFKDIFPRYKTMRGYFVLRKGGWDTHGLPVEVEVEKQLGISGKEQIENLVPGDRNASILKFNELCRENVWKYVDLWKKMVKRVGHWIDLENSYITYEQEYIESVWWSLKSLFEKDVLYQGYKVVPYCTRCETPLSSHELAQDYRETTDRSLYVKFKLQDGSYLVAWTTTAWTLPGNVALAIDPAATYVSFEENGQKLILSKEAYGRLHIKGRLDKSFLGRELVGKKYEPLYDFLSKRFSNNKKLHSVVAADFIEEGEGTGVVHTAVMYGEEDFELGRDLGLPMHHLVDMRGFFTKDATTLSGRHVHEVAQDIEADLVKNNLLYKATDYEHQYPFCWRCHKPLIYYALESWFIKTTAFKKALIENNKNVNWVPGHVRDGRMKNWYETLIDWSLSRNRYWGAPLPIWRCEACEHLIAIGSLSEIKERATSQHDWEKFDLHRPWVDDVVIGCEKCGKDMKRVPEVIDVWYESGTMPFSQWHYPYENKEKYKEQFPADFISEAIDQTRGWFYSLQAVSTLLFGKSAYKNVVVFEHVLDSEGKKMSKHIGNVLDPWEVLDKYGADATRWFFFSSVSIGTQYRVSMEILSHSLRGFIIPFWNVYNFFVTYANLDNWKPNKKRVEYSSLLDLDKWILSRLSEVVNRVTAAMDKYDSFSSSRAIEEFCINDLSQWYIRRSRDRVGPSATDSLDKENFYFTAYEVLVTLCKLLAPFIPFTSDAIYKNLTKEMSVHLSDWPEGEYGIDKELIVQMQNARKIVEMVHAQRKEKGIATRHPLSSLASVGPFDMGEGVSKLVRDEVNVLEYVHKKGKQLDIELDTNTDRPELVNMGESRRIIREIQVARREMGANLLEKVDVTIPKWPVDFEDEIKRKALVRKISKGEFKVEAVK